MLQVVLFVEDPQGAEEAPLVDSSGGRGAGSFGVVIPALRTRVEHA